MKTGCRWSGEWKRLALGLLSFMALGLLAANVGMTVHMNHMRREHILFMGAVLERVSDAYPLVLEEELIRLAEARPSEKGLDRLRKYGVFDQYGSQTFAGQERELRTLRLVMNLFLVFLGAAGGGIIFLYLRGRRQKIEELRFYMERLGRGVYRLNMEDNADDELSGLRNEIYRLTVLLREQAIVAQSQRRALSDSVANISHQLKTPLTSMTVLADNLAEDEEMDRETRRHFLSEIIRQLSGMSWLITTMLKLSKLEAGVVELRREKTPAKDLVEKCVQNLETTAELRGVSLQTRIRGDEALWVDLDWTAEALGNLVKNAIEHSAAGGVVLITADENEIYTQICIRDEGTGIPREERDKLFRRFYRGSQTAEDGVGIGLALAKEVIEGQNGQIALESEEGKGTAFFVKFMKSF